MCDDPELAPEYDVDISSIISPILITKNLDYISHFLILIIKNLM